MIWRNKTICFIVISFLILVFTSFVVNLWKIPQKTLSMQESNQAKPLLCAECTISVKVILNEVEDGIFFSSRRIYLLTDGNNFNEKNLRKLFTDFATRYNDPYNMEIMLFSDEEMLNRAIDTRKVTADMKDTEENRKYKEKHYPLSKGYFRATYFRMGEREGFSFSPGAQSEEMVAVVLKDKEVVYTNNPDTDLFLALKNYDRAKVRELVDKGIDVNITDADGDNLLMSAVLRGWDDIIEIVIQKTNKINQVNREGFTALLYASTHDDEELINQLLELGADINARTNDGFSALMLAVANEETDAVKTLLNNGAKVDFKNEYGETALSMAKKRRFKDIVNLLKGFGAKE